MWIKAAMDMKCAVNDSWFPIISVHINISKLRSGPKWPLFSNSLTYLYVCISIHVYIYFSFSFLLTSPTRLRQAKLDKYWLLFPKHFSNEISKQEAHLYGKENFIEKKSIIHHSSNKVFQRQQRKKQIKMGSLIQKEKPKLAGRKWTNHNKTLG